MTVQVQELAVGSRYRKSQELFEKGQHYLPNAISRLTIFQKPHPIYFQEGRGCRIRDVDGNEYIDFINNYTSLIHGHIHPQIEKAVIAAIQNGTAFAGTTEAELNLAMLLCERLPYVDMVRFTNSGTEAVMIAIKAARAYTGKSAIAKIEGAYHGTYDYAEVSQTSNAHNWGDPSKPNSNPNAVGTPAGVMDEVVVLPFNHVDETVALIRQNKDRLAALLLDPIPSRLGVIDPTPAYLEAIQAECHQHGILLILDEVICLRLGYHGAQGFYNIAPDLTTMAKIIGGGFPVGAVGGKRAVMEVFEASSTKRPALPHGGTFNANPITMTAGLIAMQLMTPAEFDRINSLGEMIRHGLRQVIDRLGIEWQITGRGSMFQFHPLITPLTDYRSAQPNTQQAAKLAALHLGMLDRGIFMGLPAFGCVSTAMSENEVQTVIDTAESVLREN